MGWYLDCKGLFDNSPKIEMLFVTYGRKGKEFSFYKEVRTFTGKTNIC